MTRDSEDQPGQDSTESAAERRAPHRVANDQGTGDGTATALSKMRMLERKKAEWRRRFERPSGE